ncbi:MAG TPA: amidase [Acetobacteraceae bacterium]|nr:amidase [Acetobacteraceae bacterium]
MAATDPALMTAEQLLDHYAHGSLSPVEAMAAVSERIERYNPVLNAFVVMNEHAASAARESEKRWQAGRPLGLLDGVPCTVKDLIDLAGFPTRRGSRLTSADPMVDDAPVSLALKSAGAVIIGKTTTTEFGWKSPGDCPLTGVTRNPWNPQHTPGGSSAGAAAAAAAGFGPLHIGTDGGGSIRIPAAWSGVVGLKPSFGRVPQWPLGAFATVAVAGPMTRSVGDAALLLSAIARFDHRDPYALPDDPRDWRAGMEAGVAGLRVAVLSTHGFDAPLDPTGREALTHAAHLLGKEGALVEEVDPGLPDTRAVFGRIWGVALARLVESFPETRRRMLDPGLLEVAAAESSMTAQEFIGAEALRLVVAHTMASLHRRYDLVLCPSVPNRAPLADKPTTNPVEALWQEWAPWTFTFNLSRQPAISIPLGLDETGLPRSVQIAAGLYRDDLVLRAARTIELLSDSLGCATLE